LNKAVRGLSGSKTIVIIAHKEAALQDCQHTINIGGLTALPPSKTE